MIQSVQAEALEFQWDPDVFWGSSAALGKAPNQLFMYTIIDSEHQQYGPFDESEVVHCIQSDRINGQTMIHKQGGTEWVTLSSLPEFAAALRVGEESLDANIAEEWMSTPVTPQAKLLASETNAPKIFGILNIVVCLISGVGQIFGILGILTLVRVINMLDGFAIRDYSEVKTLILVLLVLGGFRILLLVTSLIGGIGLLMRKKWGGLCWSLVPQAFC